MGAGAANSIADARRMQAGEYASYSTQDTSDSLTSSSSRCPTKLSQTGSSDASDPCDLQANMAWQHGHVFAHGLRGDGAGVEIAERLQSWESHGCKARVLQLLALKAWWWRTAYVLQVLRHLPQKRQAHFWENFGYCFVAWARLSLRARVLRLKVMVGSGVQHGLRYPEPATQLLCSCWKAWRLQLEVTAALWQQFVGGLLRSHKRQTALECLVDAMDARAEREHRDCTLALYWRADKLLVRLAFVVWQFACEAGRKDFELESLRRVLDKTGSSGKLMVKELVTQHSLFVRFVAVKTVFSCWRSLTRLQGQSRLCSSSIRKQLDAGCLGLCFIAWQAWSYGSQDNGRQNSFRNKHVHLRPSSCWFYWWLCITQQLRVEHSCPQAAEVPHFQDQDLTRADVETPRWRGTLQLTFVMWALQAERRCRQEKQVAQEASWAEQSLLLKKLILTAWVLLCSGRQGGQGMVEDPPKSAKSECRHIQLYLRRHNDAVRCVAFCSWRVGCLEARLSALHAHDTSLKQAQLSHAQARAPVKESFQLQW